MVLVRFTYAPQYPHFAVFFSVNIHANKQIYDIKRIISLSGTSNVVIQCRVHCEPFRFQQNRMRHVLVPPIQFIHELNKLPKPDSCSTQYLQCARPRVPRSQQKLHVFRMWFTGRHLCASSPLYSLSSPLSLALLVHAPKRKHISKPNCTMGLECVRA